MGIDLVTRRRSSIRLGCALALLALLTVRCSAPVRDRLMHFFFEIPPADVTAAQPEETAQVRRPSPPAMFVSIHEPFARRQCSACHSPEQPMLQRGDPRRVCGACHVDVFVPRAFVHGPVAAGACQQCHSPHMSAVDGLLIAGEPQLCLDCHEDTMDWQSVSHRNAQTCSACHEAHASDERFLLRASPDRRPLPQNRDDARPG